MQGDHTFFETFFEQDNTFNIILDSDNSIKRLNYAACKFLQQDKRLLIGNSIAIFFPSLLPFIARNEDAEFSRIELQKNWFDIKIKMDGVQKLVVLTPLADSIRAGIVNSSAAILLEFSYYGNKKIKINFISEIGHFIPGLSPSIIYDNSEILINAIHPLDIDNFWSSIEASKDTGKFWQCEFRVVLGPNNFVWAQVIARAEHIIGDEFRFKGHLNNITPLKNTEAELRDNLLIHSYLSKTVQEAIWDWNTDSDIISWGDRASSVLKLPKEMLPTDSSWQKHVHPEDYPIANRTFNEFLENEEIQKWEQAYRFKNGDGEYIHVVDRAYAIRDKNGKAKRVIGSIQNITKETLSNRDRAIIINKALRNERENISTELHDKLGQYLIALNLFMGGLKTEENTATFEKCVSLLNECIQRTRDLCYKMTPPELNNGLLRATENMFKEYEANNAIQFDIHIEPTLTAADFKDIDEFQNYRIIQEFVSNSILHSKCNSIYCEIFKFNNSIFIELSDDGCGFNLNDEINFGKGILNIFQRSQVANSFLCFDSNEKNGTFLKLKLNKAYHHI